MGKGKGSMRMELAMELEGVGRVNARVGLPEFLAFEREYDRPASAVADGDRRLEWVLFLAHRALRRQGTSGVPADLDNFAAIVVDLDAAAPEGAGADERQLSLPGDEDA